MVNGLRRRTDFAQNSPPASNLLTIFLFHRRLVRYVLIHEYYVEGGVESNHNEAENLAHERLFIEFAHKVKGRQHCEEENGKRQTLEAISALSSFNRPLIVARWIKRVPVYGKKPSVSD